MTRTSPAPRQINLRRITFQVLFVLGLLTVDAIIAAIVSPGVFRFHQLLTLPGVVLVRAFTSGHNPFEFNAPTWGEMLLNAAIYCTFAAALAFLYQKRRRWRNIFLLSYGPALATVLAAWLLPHKMIKPWGGKTRSVVLLGDGSIWIEYSETIDETRGQRGDFKTVSRDLAPGVHYRATTGPEVGDDLADLAAFISGGPKKRPTVRNHQYMIQIWVLLLPFLAYPAAICLVWLSRGKRYTVCLECGYNLTRFGGSNCPNCRAPKPNAEPVSGGMASDATRTNTPHAPTP